MLICCLATEVAVEMVEGEGFEPSKAVPADLQSDPFGHSGTPPLKLVPLIRVERMTY